MPRGTARFDPVHDWERERVTAVESVALARWPGVRDPQLLSSHSGPFTPASRSTKIILAHDRGPEWGPADPQHSSATKHGMPKHHFWRRRLRFCWP